MLRTGAKVGSKCTPKVLAITKPEEKWKQAKKGTAYTTVRPEVLEKILMLYLPQNLFKCSYCLLSR